MVRHKCFVQIAPGTLLARTEVKGGSAAWMGKKEFFKGKFHTDEIAVAAVNRKLPLRFAVSLLRDRYAEIASSPLILYDTAQCGGVEKRIQRFSIWCVYMLGLYVFVCTRSLRSAL